MTDFGKVELRRASGNFNYFGENWSVFQKKVEKSTLACAYLLREKIFIEDYEPKKKTPSMKFEPSAKIKLSEGFRRWRVRRRLRQKKTLEDAEAYYKRRFPHAVWR
jgi:hypothetical protein